MIQIILFIVLFIHKIHSLQYALYYNEIAYIYIDDEQSPLTYPYFVNNTEYKSKFKTLIYLRNEFGSGDIRVLNGEDNTILNTIWFEDRFQILSESRCTRYDINMTIYLPDSLLMLGEDFLLYTNEDPKLYYNLVYCGEYDFSSVSDVLSDSKDVVIYVSEKYPSERFFGKKVIVSDEYCSTMKSEINGTKIIFSGTDVLLKSIVEKSFTDSIEHVVIKDGIWSIGMGSFNGRQFDQISFPITLTSIGTNAFANNKKLKKVNLPPGVDKINSNTFANCDSLEEIRIPFRMKTIAEDAFNGCPSIKKVTFCGQKDITNGKNIFGNSKGQIDVIVKKGVFEGKTFAGMNVREETNIDCEIANWGDSSKYYNDLGNSLFIFLGCAIGAIRVVVYIVYFLIFILFRIKRKENKNVLLKYYIVFGIVQLFIPISLVIVSASTFTSNVEMYQDKKASFFMPVKADFGIGLSLSVVCEFLLCVSFMAFLFNKTVSRGILFIICHISLIVLSIFTLFVGIDMIGHFTSMDVPYEIILKDSDVAIFDTCQTTYFIVWAVVAFIAIVSILFTVLLCSSVIAPIAVYVKMFGKLKSIDKINKDVIELQEMKESFINVDN